MRLLPELAAIAVLFYGAAAFALDAPLTDPHEEARAQALFQGIRCVVCQSESIADSQAEVASDMRRDIRTRIEKGEDDEAIRQELVARYGDYILMRPPLKAATALLWFGPLLILLAGFSFARTYFRKQP